jgi:hypothetical protein
MSEESNWVERRFATDSSLEKNAPQLWQDVRAALQDACTSFVALYGHSRGTAVNVGLENGHRLQIMSMTRGAEAPSFLVVSFDSKVHEIGWVGDNAEAIKISADRNGAFLAGPDGKRITPDELSQRILEPFLFGKP